MMVVPRFGFDPYNTVDFGVSVAVLVPIWNKKKKERKPKIISNT